jgi:hypothetical protein
MDVVYLVGEVLPELRYSLRSLQNVEHDNVWIVSGSLPGWAAANLLPVGDMTSGKSRNLMEKFRQVAACGDISEDFIYFNDDFFAVAPTQAPNWRSGTLDEYQGRVRRKYCLSWRESMCVTRQVLVDSGQTTHDYEMHLPMVFNQQRLAEVLSQVEGYEIQVRSLYGNYWQVGGEERDDVKISNGRDVWPAGREWVSTSDLAFRSGAAGNKIRAQFPDACGYEK